MTQPNNVIFKYPLEITDTQSLMLHEGAEILSVGKIDGQVVAWAYINLDNDRAYVPIAIVGTGNPAENVEKESRFIGTVIQEGQWGNLVWHIFEGLHRTPF